MRILKRIKSWYLIKCGRCPICGLKFSDWFVWGHLRHCYACWVASGYTWTVGDDGNRYHTMSDGSLRLIDEEG